MSTKRQPSKQRRQTQNQKQRAALEARRQAAAAGRAPAGKVGSEASSGSSGSALSRLRGARTSGRTARTAGPTRAARAGAGRGGLPVGHRAALSALLAAIAGALVGALLFQVPVDRGGETVITREALVAEWVLSATEVARAQPEASPEELADSVTDWTPGGTEPYAQAFWPISAAILLPVLGTGLGFRAVSRRSPAKLVNRTMYVTLFGALLASQVLIIFLPAVISLGVAAFQVRKAEVAAAQAAALEAAEAEPAADSDDVIEVDEVTEVEEVDDGNYVNEIDEPDDETEHDDGPPR